MSSRIKCCIVGIPDHQGVVNVGGRLGAARGPEAFRRVFNRMRGRVRFGEGAIDAGDVPISGSDVSLNHRRAADLIRASHLEAGVSVIIGGGHDHGFSHLLGLREALEERLENQQVKQTKKRSTRQMKAKSKGSSKKVRKKVRLGCLNIDAHLDVRKPSPRISSGSPFYLAIESGVLDPKRFVEFGIQSHCNSPELWSYVEEQRVEVIEMAALRQGRAVPTYKKAFRKLASQSDFIAISLDLDAVATAFAPGVSAPQSEGFTPSEILEMVEFSASHQKTVSLGIFELNPEHDVDDQTARLAATAAFHFIQAVLFRPALSLY